jgi:hypothetical protein
MPWPSPGELMLQAVHKTTVMNSAGLTGTVIDLLLIIMNTSATPQRKRNWRTLWTILIMIPIMLGAGALGAMLWWNAHKKQIIREKLESAVSDKTNGLYQVKYDSTEMDELDGNLSFYDLHLAYDSAKYASTVKNGTAPPLLFTVDIPEISVTGVKTTRAMSKSEIVGKKLLIREPVINLYYTYEGKDAGNLPTDDVYKEILGGLKLVKVDTILLSKATIRTLSKKTGRLLAEGRNINITLNDVKIDSAAFTDNSRMMFSKSVNIQVADINWASNDHLYKFNIQNISINSAANSVSVAHFNMKPTLGEDAFVNAKRFQDDRFDFAASDIRLSGVDVQRFLKEDVHADNLSMNASVKLYRDLARPRDNMNRVGHYPHEVLDNVPFSFTIKRASITNSYIEYKERNNITRNSGRVRFSNANAVINNFTNDKKNAGQIMELSFNGRFLDISPFSSNWKFYLFHPQGKFDVTATAGAIDGLALNQLVEPMGPAHIREGNLHSLSANLHGDDYNMNGTVKLLYDNLKVDLLELDKGQTKTDKKFLTSLIANVVIKNSNPKGNESPRVINVSMARNTNRSLFWFCWKTIFKGIRETVGIKGDMTVNAKS